MKTDRRWLLGVLFALPLVFSATVTYADDDTVVRWDLINLVAPGICPVPGGVASATTHHGPPGNDVPITLTGSGTFQPNDREEVTGGGTWTTATGSGTYKVIELVSWHPAPGVLPCAGDTIPGERSAGLAVVRIKYDDGSKGVLAISCRLGGTPPEVFEGIAVSKGFIGYVHNAEPVPGVQGNRTLFHIQEGDDDDDDD